MTEANGILAHAKDEMRARIFNMRSDTLFTQGPEKVFTELSRKFARSGVVSVRTHFRGLPDHLAESVFSEVVFIVGEAITNAVKHGISKKRGGGTLTIATRETDKFYEVIVSDDGTGFDVNEVKNDGRSHIGVENVRVRIEKRVNGKLEIFSTKGKGTTAVITIPKLPGEKSNVKPDDDDDGDEAVSKD